MEPIALLNGDVTARIDIKRKGCHWRHWRLNGDNGDPLVTMASLAPKVTMVRVWVWIRISTIVAIVFIGTICYPLAPMTPFVPLSPYGDPGREIAI